jgi:benzoate-CoA ligase family protein
MNSSGALEEPALYNLTERFVDRHIIEGRGGLPAIRCGDRVWTYHQVFETINRAGNLLKALGIHEEQRVLIALPDSAEFVVSYFAALKIGAVAVPTNTALQAHEYCRCLDDSRARVLIVAADLLPRFAPILADRPFLSHVVVVGRTTAAAYLDWEAGLAAHSPILDPAPTAADDVAFWLWTSGTTGRPKAAVHLHQDWTHCCEGYARGVLDIRLEDVTFSSSKLFHAYGLGNGLMFPFYVGATTVLLPGKATADVVLATVERERPTLFFSVPTLYSSMLAETDQQHSHDFSSVRLAVSAAEPLAADIFVRWARRFGVEILDGLGSTEVLHIYVSARPGRVKPGSAGQPVPGYDVRITDANGNAASEGEIGDVQVRGFSTALWYWSRRRATTDRMRGEWFHTGDKAYRDHDGYLWYAGRSDDMFRVSGEWVSPIELEHALIEHRTVLEAAVVPYQDEHRVTKSMAYVVLKSGAAPTDDLARDLQAFVRERVTHYKCPRRIEFVDHLPKTAAGKIQRFRLRTGDAGPGQ